jgi:hypothetical protein
MHLDPAPARQHHGQPTSRFPLVGDFLAANSTGTKQPAEEVGLLPVFHRPCFRWQSRVLNLKPDSQTRSAAYRCSQTRPPTAEAPHSYIAWALTALFLRSSGHCNTDPACRTRVLLRLLRVLRGAYTPLHHGDTETRRDPCSCSVFPLTSPSSQCLRGRESSDIRNSVQ